MSAEKGKGERKSNDNKLREGIEEECSGLQWILLKCMFALQTKSVIWSLKKIILSFAVWF